MGANTAFSVDQAALHGVWMADALAPLDVAVSPTGHAALDAQLPGAGWPLGALVELLQTTSASSLWPLMLPALARQAQTGRVALIQAPHEPYVPALVAAGVPWAQTLWITPATPAQAAWAAEQALRCQDVGAVVAWLPRANAGDLRRLHQAAASTGALLFVVRPAQAAQAASPARVRLRVASQLPPLSRPRLRLVGAVGTAGAPPEEQGSARLPQLRIDLVKRRGPPLATPIWLPAASPALLSVLRAAQALLAPGPAPWQTFTTSVLATQVPAPPATTTLLTPTSPAAPVLAPVPPIRSAPWAPPGNASVPARNTAPTPAPAPAPAPAPSVHLLRPRHPPAQAQLALISFTPPAADKDHALARPAVAAA